MTKTLYQSEIRVIGNFAQDLLLNEGILITFKEGAPSDLVDYCVIHDHSELIQPIISGNKLLFGNKTYLITAVGDIANQNLKELGHITVRFDGSTIAELPGSIHVQGNKPETLIVGEQFKVTT